MLKGILDFSSLRTPINNPPPAPQEENSAQKSPEGASFFDNLPPIGSTNTLEVNKPAQPRRILLSKPPSSDNDSNIPTTPKRLINLGGSLSNNGNATINTPTNGGGLFSNNISSINDNSQTISGIVFPPLPGQPANSSANQLSPIRPSQSPIIHNDPPKPIFAATQQQQMQQQQANVQMSPRLNQSMPPAAIQQEPLVNTQRDNLTEILPRRTPAEYFECSITNSLDRSLNTFKRSVTREISSAFRPNSSSFDVSLFDSFLTGLINDVAGLFEVPQTNIAASETSVTKKLSQTFDEGAKPIRKLFIDAEVKASQVRDRRVDELKSLNNALNDLRNAVKGIADATLQELERERFDAATRRDEEQARAREIERKARTLKLKRADLDSKLSHQKIEKESLERLVKQMEDARREWEETPTDIGNNIAQKIQKEIEALRSELTGDSTNKLDGLMQECASMMANVRDGLRDEVCEMDMAEKWAISRMRSPMRRPPMSRYDPQPQQAPMGNRQPLVQYAQDMIVEKRKEREANLRDMSQSYNGFSFTQNQT